MEYDKFIEQQDCKDFLSVWAHMRDKYARALLVLFHISHVIILTHPTHTFDYSYVHLFRAMDIVRYIFISKNILFYDFISKIFYQFSDRKFHHNFLMS